MMGKGSVPRPIPDPEKFRDNWDKIFGSRKEAEGKGKKDKEEKEKK